MGRCYEFGVSIRGGCEHAMVVPDDGGRCECVQCGSVCTGQFKACTKIIGTPGYVPSTAPSWALVELRTAVTDGSTTAAAEGAEAIVVGPDVADVEAPDPLAALTDLVESLGKRLEERDAELAALFERITETFDGLHASIAELRETVEGIARNDDGTSSSLFRFRRRGTD